MSFRVIASLSIALMLVAMPSTGISAAGSEPGVQVLFDPDGVKDQNAVTPWLAYLMVRAEYIKSHPELYANQSGKIAPRFEEEFKARTEATQVYLELKEQNKSLHAAYFEDLAKVKGAGFMIEYVWACCSQRAWKDPPAPERMVSFKSWMTNNLPKHKPETYGAIVIQH